MTTAFNATLFVLVYVIIERHLRHVIIETLKTCSTCKTQKPISNFYNDEKKKYQTMRKICSNQYGRNWRAKNPGYNRIRRQQKALNPIKMIKMNRT
ncbi:MAG: hypothetical protein WA667_23550 [Candidatus Nitrosopolaris sp.]